MTIVKKNIRTLAMITVNTENTHAMHEEEAILVTKVTVSLP